MSFLIEIVQKPVHRLEKEKLQNDSILEGKNMYTYNNLQIISIQHFTIFNNKSNLSVS